MKRRALWLVGDARIAASPSPALHDAVFGAGTYALHPAACAEDAFAAAERSCRGINVTAPFKVAAATRYAAVLDDRARCCGAVNTVVYDDHGRAVRAANTDVPGLLWAWRRAHLMVDRRRIAVIGAGGAARAAIVAAAEAGAASLLLHARRPETLPVLVALAASLGIDARVAGGGDRGDVLVIAASDLDDVAGWIDRALAPAGTVHDLRYGSRTTAVRDAALRRGAFFSDGTTMLLGQAMEAAALFGGSPLDAAQQQAMTRAMAVWLRDTAHR